MHLPSPRVSFLTLILALVCAVPLFNGCHLGDCVRGKGAVIKRPLKVGPFNGVSASGSLDIRFYKGGEQGVEVEGQPELIDLLSTEVTDGIWRIESTACYSTNERFVVHITSPRIDHIAMHGSGNVQGKDTFHGEHIVLHLDGSGGIDMSFDAPRITTVVQGSGDIELKGRCDSFSATVQGSGDIDADELLTTDADATVQGSGDISVNVSGTLSANVGGSGNITYKGTPAKVNKNINGSGDVERIP